LSAVGQPVQHFITRQALHASSVEFALPSGGKLKLEAALPADFATALEQLRQLC
jgi:hypothetical protein